MIKLFSFCLTVLFLFPNGGYGQGIGPERGSLVIVGGGMRDLSILERFMDLAGGNDAPIVVIPTAGGGDQYDEFYQGLNSFRAVGATNLTVLHTTDPAVANTDEFVQPLLDAHGV